MWSEFGYKWDLNQIQTLLNHSKMIALPCEHSEIQGGRDTQSYGRTIDLHPHLSRINK